MFPTKKGFVLMNQISLFRAALCLAAVLTLSLPRAGAAPLPGLTKESYGALKELPVFIQEWHFWWGFPYPDRQQTFSHLDSTLTAEREPWRLYWNRNGYPYPGPYDSANPDIMRWQIRCMKAAGFETVAAMLHPEWSVGIDYIQEENSNLVKTALDIAAEEKFPIFFMDEVAFRNGSPAQKPEVMVQRFVRFLKLYGSHPGFYRIDGKPVIYFQTFGMNITPEELSGVFDRVEEQAGPVHWMIFGDVARFSGVKKLCSVVCGASLHRKNAATRKWQLDFQDPAPIFAAARKAGKKVADMQYVKFDGTSQPLRQPGVLAYGLGGRRLEKTMLDSFRSGPDFLMVSSWNDWEEGTTMEPGWDFDGFTDDPYLYCRVMAHLKGRDFTPPPPPPKESVHPTIHEKLGYGDGAGPLVESIERSNNRGGTLTVTVRDTVSEVTGLEVVWEGDLYWKAPQGKEGAATGNLALQSSRPVKTRQLRNVFNFTPGRAVDVGNADLTFDAPELRTLEDNFHIGVATVFRPKQPFGKLFVTVPNKIVVRRLEPKGGTEENYTFNFTPHARNDQFPKELWDGWRTVVGANPRPVDFNKGALTLKAPGQQLGLLSILREPKEERVLHDAVPVPGSDGRHKRFHLVVPDEILDQPGASFVWLRACDAAGNWGSPVLYAFPNYEEFDRSAPDDEVKPLEVPGALLTSNSASSKGWKGDLKIDRDSSFGTVFLIGNGMAEKPLDRPLTGSFELSFDVIHLDYQRLILVGLLDDASRHGILTSWDSAAADALEGNGLAGIRLVQEDAPLTWGKTGIILEQNDSKHPAVSPEKMAKFVLTYDAATRRAVLTVDGRKVAETVLKEPLGPLSKLYVRGNDTQLLNNFVVLPQK